MDKIKIIRESLEFYADERNYDSRKMYVASCIDADEGYRAKEALQSLSELEQKHIPEARKKVEQPVNSGSEDIFEEAYQAAMKMADKHYARVSFEVKGVGFTVETARLGRKVKELEAQLSQVKPSVCIGEYEIYPCQHGGLWIRHESGEGMQVSEDIFKKFYNDNF